MNFMDTNPTTFWGSLQQNFNFLCLLPSMISWMGRHGDSATLPALNAVLKEARELAVKNGNGKLGIIGFCWGGRYSILAAGGDAPMVDAYAAAHPSNLSVPKDVDAIHRPGLFLLAENDFVFSESNVKATEEILSKKEDAPAEFVKYPGTKHGFSVRGGPNSAWQRKQAQEKVIEFFGRVLR
jgi:dienelactone hydrolase